MTHPAVPAVTDRTEELTTRDLASLVDRALARTRDRLADASDRDAVIRELGDLQALDLAVQTHLNRLGAAVYGGRHPKHWLWKSHKRWILDRVRPTDRVLDVGCGASAYLLWMAEMGCSVVAMDRRQEVLDIAASIMSHENLSFVRGDITAGPPPAPGGAFDVAVCSHVIEHLDDPVVVLRALRDAAPRLIVAVPPVDSRWQKVMHRDLGLPWKDDEDHRREYTPELLREQLESSGWTVRELHAGIDIKAIAD